jgi:hypothetical protein
MALNVGIRETRYQPDAAERQAFERQHWIRLPAFLDAALLRRVDRALANTQFTEVRHDTVAAGSSDLRAIGAAVSELLVLLCNDPIVLRAVEDISGYAPLTRFNGSIYRMVPEMRHRQGWHDDLIDGRRVTLSVNVSTSSYAGGVLEIRDRTTGRMSAQICNGVRGDAVLFGLDPSLEHRVTAVTSGVKTAFAGWFRHGTPLGDELRKAV